MERAKPQAAADLVSQAGKNVSRKTRKPAQLNDFSFQNYQYNGQYIALLVDANFTCSPALTRKLTRTCLVQQFFKLII